MPTKLYDVSVSYNGGSTWQMLGTFEGVDERFAIRAARQRYQIHPMVLATAVPATSDLRRSTQRVLEKHEERGRTGISYRAARPHQDPDR